MESLKDLISQMKLHGISKLKTPEGYEIELAQHKAPFQPPRTPEELAKLNPTVPRRSCACGHSLGAHTKDLECKRGCPAGKCKLLIRPAKDEPVPMPIPSVTSGEKV